MALEIERKFLVTSDEWQTDASGNGIARATLREATG